MLSKHQCQQHRAYIAMGHLYFNFPDWLNLVRAYSQLTYTLNFHYWLGLGGFLHLTEKKAFEDSISCPVFLAAVNSTHTAPLEASS